MFDKLKQFVGIQAATQLPLVAPPKVKSGPVSWPTYLKTTKPANAALPKADRRLATTDVNSYRSGNNSRQVMRDFAAASPDLSASIFSYLRLAITDSYTAVARDLDGTANPEATALLQQLLTRFEVLNDYSDGFSGTWSMQSVSESLAKEILLYGSCAAELVLGKDRLPRRIMPISVTNIEFWPDGKILKPVQLVGGEKIDLDTPAFAMVALDQDLLEPYSASPLEPALRQVIMSEDFLNDLWRALKRVVHPRVKVTIDEQKFIDSLPSDALHDENKLREYQNALLSDLESKINSLDPQDALIYFDSITMELENNGNISYGAELKEITDIINARLATGSKTLPALLGRANSSNIASTESMIFVKNAGVIKRKLEEIYSRMLTLAVRLFGFDVSVQFKYAAIDLRPENEVLAFKQTQQMIILEQLSLGLISDEEACLTLTGHLPPKGFKPLSGTMFKSGSGAGGSNLYNGQSNDGSTLNQNLKSDQPATARGQNTKDKGKKAEAEVLTLYQS